MLRVIALAGAFAAAALPALAESLALIVVNRNYDSIRDIRGAPASDAVAALRDAGFAVVEVENARFAAMAEAVDGVRDRLAAAERVVIVLSGHFVTAGEAGWMLARDARRPSDLTVGAQALSVEAVLAMAAAHPGAAVVMLAQDGAPVALGAGLTAGHGPAGVPQGVTVLAGPMRGLVEVMSGGLMEPGTPVAEALETLPDGVTASGFVSGAVALIPVESVGAAGAPAAEPETADPIALAQAAEAGLALSRETRQQIQRDLSLLGFDTRGIDGIFGRGTRSAIAAWQGENDFETTGYLTGNQVARLQEQGAARARELEAEAARRQAEEDRKDGAYWRETGANGDEAGLRAYLERYPDGLFSDLAKDRLAAIEEERRAQAGATERAFWEDVRSADTVGAYERYLETYPRGAFRAEAQARLEELRAEEASRDTVERARAEEGDVAGNPITRLLIERRLAQLGADPGRVDGVFDDATRRAVRRFQRSRDLPVTGYVTEATMVQLLSSAQ